MGNYISYDEYELDTTHIEYYHNVLQNCGTAGMYVPLPYVKKNRKKDDIRLSDIDSISADSTASLNSIVAAHRKSLHENSSVNSSLTTNSSLQTSLLSTSDPVSFNYLSHSEHRPSEGSLSKHSIETIRLSE